MNDSRLIFSEPFSYFLFIFHLTRCTLLNFPSVSSPTFLPFLPCCHRTTAWYLFSFLYSYLKSLADIKFMNCCLENQLFLKFTNFKLHDVTVDDLNTFVMHSMMHDAWRLCMKKPCKDTPEMLVMYSFDDRFHPKSSSLWSNYSYIGMHVKLTHFYKDIEHIQRFIRSKFLFPENKNKRI